MPILVAALTILPSSLLSAFYKGKVGKGDLLGVHRAFLQDFHKAHRSRHGGHNPRAAGFKQADVVRRSCVLHSGIRGVADVGTVSLEDLFFEGDHAAFAARIRCNLRSQNL